MSRQDQIGQRLAGLVPSELSDRVPQLIASKDWVGILFLGSSPQRVSIARVMWPILSSNEKPFVLAVAIGSGDAIYMERPWLVRVLTHPSRQWRMFDGDEAKAAFAELPDTVTIYRGTVAQEAISGELGLSWTLDRDRALWYAKDHIRFRNRQSKPILLEAQIAKDSILGYLCDRNEQEIVTLTPDNWQKSDA